MRQVFACLLLPDTMRVIWKSQLVAMPERERVKLISKGNLTPDGDLIVAFGAELEPEGLGDKVHDLLAPAANAIDRVFGTNLTNCSACDKRRRLLNRISRIFTGD